MRLTVVRHGQTPSNIAKVCDGKPSGKTSLTAKGRWQAQQVAEKLKHKNFDILYVSEFLRTQLTADIIRKDMEKIIDKRLNDTKVGAFDKRPVEQFHAWREQYGFNAKTDDGETFEEEKQRVFSFLNELKAKDYENVLIVTHEEPMQIMRGYFVGMSNEEMLANHVNNCEILEFEL